MENDGKDDDFFVGVRPHDLCKTGPHGCMKCLHAWIDLDTSTSDELQGQMIFYGYR